MYDFDDEESECLRPNLRCDRLTLVAFASFTRLAISRQHFDDFDTGTRQLDIYRQPASRHASFKAGAITPRTPSIAGQLPHACFSLI